MVLHRELRLKVNLLKTLEIILVHDLVEAIADDVWILDKNNYQSLQKIHFQAKLPMEHHRHQGNPPGMLRWTLLS
jgi:5'-deoxynucleotidase YfbR-like HD superfamily hydrolase